MGLNHTHMQKNVQAVPRVMQKNKLFHMSCHVKNRMQNRAKKQAVPHVMQKPCKNHAKCGAYGAPTRRTLTVPRVLAMRAICAIWVSQGKPPNLHSPPAPCYMCYMGLTRQATEPHSPPAPCYMCYMCYMVSKPVYYTHSICIV